MVSLPAACDAGEVETTPVKRTMFAPAPDQLPEEIVEVIDSAAGTVRIERVVSRGHTSPDGYWYDQDEDEWVWLLRGAARLEVELPHERQPGAPINGMAVREISLTEGDYLLLPAHVRHRVGWTAPATDTVWLAVFLRRG